MLVLSCEGSYSKKSVDYLVIFFFVALCLFVCAHAKEPVSHDVTNFISQCEILDCEILLIEGRMDHLMIFCFVYFLHDYFLFKLKSLGVKVFF